MKKVDELPHNLADAMTTILAAAITSANPEIADEDGKQRLWEELNAILGRYETPTLGSAILKETILRAAEIVNEPVTVERK